MAGWIGTILQVGGTLAKGQSDKRDAAENARYLELQGNTAETQGLADEELQRRQGRQALGTQAAAMGQAGISGFQGQQLIKQSALNAELDALDIRYQGQLRKAGLLSEASATRKKGSGAAANSGFLAASQLIDGYSKNYRGS